MCKPVDNFLWAYLSQTDYNSWQAKTPAIWEDALENDSLAVHFIH